MNGVQASKPRRGRLFRRVRLGAACRAGPGHSGFLVQRAMNSLPKARPLISSLIFLTLFSMSGFL